MEDRGCDAISHVKNIIDIRGYHIWKRAAVLEDSGTILNLLARNNRRFACIFNPDRRRLQLSVDSNTCQPLKEVMEKVKSLVSTVDETLRCDEFFLVKSKKGCERQQAHMDYVPNSEPNETLLLSYSVIVALEEGSHLIVWPGSHEAMRNPAESYPISPQDIPLRQGDVLIFRGDLIHAGGEYPLSENVRMHCYCDNALSKRKSNTTWVVSTCGSPEQRELILGDC